MSAGAFGAPGTCRSRDRPGRSGSAVRLGRPGWDGKPTLTPRTPEEWRASSTLFLTQEGFPAGRAVPSRTDPGDDQSRFQSLAVLYAELATSDRVKALAEKGGKIDGEILAEPVIYTIGQFATPVVLPMVRISVTADTARAAVKDAGRVSRALQNYVTSGQVGPRYVPKSECSSTCRDPRATRCLSRGRRKRCRS